MGSVIVLTLLVVAAFIMLWYLFNEARIELNPPTIAAMEAHAEAVEARRTAEMDAERESAAAPEHNRRGSEYAYETVEDGAEAEEPPLPAATDYEYREMLDEGGENYVLPQWMVNFFSSGDICHTLDPSDNVLFVVNLNDPKNAEAGIIDMSAECDMSTQTITLKLCFGEGAAAETLRTKFYLFERGDLFELNRLVRQGDVRIDVLTRAADYTFEYACTVHTRLPQNVSPQLKNVLAKIPS